jgi:ATP-binding cassette subfamily C (CFTR/MRP) protein 1
VPQTAWIENKTVKENILFGDEYDEEKYLSVINAACMIEDIKKMKNKDETKIEFNGANLSGG